MVNYSLDTVFGSLSDNTRRDILQRLAQGELAISQIADTYSMSLPAISKHLKILEQSGLVAKEKRGRQYFIHLTPAGFSSANDHLHYYEAALTNRLDSLNAFLRNESHTDTNATLDKAEDQPQELVFKTVLDADLKAAWKAYTEPASIAQWWASSNAKTANYVNNVRVGGIWRFVVQKPGGNEYVFSGKYTAVSYPTALAYTDGVGEADTPRPEAYVRVTFEALPGSKTLLTKRSTALPAIHQLQAAWLKAAVS